MKKKQEVIVYPNFSILYDFCEDYSKTILFLQHIKNIILKFLFANFIYLIISILLIIFKLNNIILSIILFFVFTIICIILFIPLISKKRLKLYLLDLYPSFWKLLNKKEYINLNSLTMLKEIEYYIRNIKNPPKGTLKSNHSNIGAIIIFLLSTAISMILSLISNKLNPYIYLSLLIILIVLFCFALVFKDLLDMLFSKNYDHITDSILLSCIEERRLEIIKSSQKNIFTKIKYTLRLGEYH